MLYRYTTSEELFNVLSWLMSLPELSDFRLVGGTALSLLRGRRKSVDIDMFCDGPYGEIPFDHRLEVLRFRFSYVEETSPFSGSTELVNNRGFNLFIGSDEESAIKTDILY
jgi:hypothetical protein